MQKTLLEDIKKTVIFLGYLKGDQNNPQEQLIGTAFLVQIENIFCLVTAKHVIAEINEHGQVIKLKEHILAFNNFIDKSKGVKYVSIDNYIKQGFNRFFHTESKVDLAIMPFPLNISEDDVKVCADDNFLMLEGFSETDDMFFLSYHPGVTVLANDGAVMPIIRKGIVARKNLNKTFLIDGFVFPGNSGSPVYMMPTAIRTDNNGDINLGGDSLGGKFVGVISSYIPYQDIAISAQTNRPRVIFEENTGLSTIQSCDLLLEITKQTDFQIKLDELKKQ